ncbi:MAG TPA: HAMP domain-containing sensor histidine kinase, partial [Solirubrobacteraceae bacterium]
ARTMRPGSPRLRRVAAELGRRAQARVAVLDAQGHRLFDTDPDQGPAVADALAALHSSRPIRRIVPGGAFGEAQVAARVKAGHRAYVVALRKRLNDIGSTENAVVSALTRAALVGLAAAILLGVGFATAMLRRLRRLRDAAIRFGGPDGDPEPEIDDRDDELGDLSRAFADMQARLARQEELRRAFVATASHELRTPLMSLSGMLELAGEDLSRHPPDVEEARRQLAGAREQSERMSRLATDLLDISRLDAQLELRREPVELGELGRAVIAELDNRAQRAGVDLMLDAHDSCWAAADPSATARVVRILLDNALRYAPAGTAITVGIGGQNGAAALSVADRGPGIAPDERQHVFERFTRGGDATQEGGFGLGLAIGRELAERMDGSLALVDCDAGATFLLTLPAGPVHQA